MPKLFNLGPGLSNRVHQALLRRLERFMAASAEASAREGATDFPMTENPPMSAGLAGNDMDGDKPGDQVSQLPPPGDVQKTPTEREDEDRSRSPRLRSPEASLGDTKELLASTTGLAVSMTSLVASLKGFTTRMDAILEQSKKGHEDLTKSMGVLGNAITGMSRSVESLSGGVSYHASRTGAIAGEVTKMRKHLEWCLNVNMKDTLKSNQEGRDNRDETQQDLMNKLCEAMEMLQENMKKVAERIEKIQMEKAEERPKFDPPQAPMGHHDMPNVAPMTPGYAVSGTPPPPPPVVPAAGSGTPSKQDYTPPTLPLARFAGFSPARLGEPPMSRALPLAVDGMKQACHMQDEATGKIFSVSPTARPSPLTGTATFAPLGYVKVKGTTEYHRVYP